MQHNKDKLWKGILEWVLDDLLRFVFPNAEEVFDLDKRIVYLDKELAALDPEPGKTASTRFADNLAKVYRKDGGEEWVLVHVEVQDKTAATGRPMFPERMFRYFYRCFDRHQRPVVAIAIFCGPDGKLLEGCYKYEFMNTRVQYEYNTLCILDYSDNELQESENPFAWVVLAAKDALLSGKDLDSRLLEGKMFIFRKLYEKRVFQRRKLQAVLRFFDCYVRFENPETNRIFRDKIDEFTHKKNTMDIFKVATEIEVEERVAEVVRNLLTETEFSDEKIAKLAGVSVEFVEEVKVDMKKK